MRIDAYTHYLPPRFKQAVKDAVGRPFPPLSTLWEELKTLTDIPMRLAIMDEFEIDKQVVTTPSPPLDELFDAERAAALARLANEEMAELMERYPQRFIGTATVSLLDPEGAIAEAQRAVRELGLRGVLIYTSVRGKPLDDPALAPFFAAMEELDVPIWLHPARSDRQPDYPGEERSRYLMWQVFGWPIDSTLAMARLVFSGTMQRHPGLKIIVHHAGAMVPFFAERIAKLYPKTEKMTGTDFAPGVEKPYINQFRRFYVDTVTQGSVSALMNAYHLYGADRMLMASDMPFDIELGREFTREAVRSVERMMIPEEEREKIFAGNLLRLCNLSA